MGRLADEMNNLRHKVQELADDRRELISRLKNDSARRCHETQQTLADFRRQRREKTDSLRQELEQGRQESIAFLQDLQSDTARMRAAFRRDLDANARHFTENTKASIIELRSTITNLLSSWGQERRQRSAQLREELTTFRSELSASMPDFKALAKERSQSVSAIRQGAQALRQSSHLELAEKAHSGRVERQQFIDKLQQDVADLSRNAQHKRREVIADLVALRQIWRGEAQTQQTEPLFSDYPSVENFEETQTQSVSQPVDDLTLIDGIGPVRARLLQASGIQTFVQLAQSTVAELLEVIGNPGVPVNVESWIAEAARFNDRG